ncbi:MAG: hypothetical protein IPL35_17270 [Sphingobacteriales bacterium]|nr:hypothetical protein [Sphingobacteriales bacterium]
MESCGEHYGNDDLYLYAECGTMRDYGDFDGDSKQCNNPYIHPIAAICSGGSITLPTTSTNSIGGSWSPAVNNTATTTYTFTPSAGQCVSTATLTVTVNNATTPTFSPIAAICSGGSITLPTTSTNSIGGSWSPAVNNTATTTYTFTPAAGQCANTATLTVTVNAPVTPTFSPIAAICSGGSITLPTTSTNSIGGSWSPAVNNTATTTYTFTPGAGQCASTATMTVTVNVQPPPPSGLACYETATLNASTCAWEVSGVEPPAPTNLACYETATFDGVACVWVVSGVPPICDDNDCGTQDSYNTTTCACVHTPIPPPNCDDNDCSTQDSYDTTTCACVHTPIPPPNCDDNDCGTQDSYNTASCTCEHTPVPPPICDDNDCSTDDSYDSITCQCVYTPNGLSILPVFTALSPICSGGNITLPTTSTNSIGGSWSPAVNNTATTTYTFTPSGGQCASTATLTVTVNNQTPPTFSPIAAICSGGSITLPTTSTNGIGGSWIPAVNNTATTTYTFTPSGGQCASTSAMTVVIQNAVVPQFSIENTYCNGAATDLLPSVSDNGITGVWSPGAISNSSSGSYTFTPQANNCALPYILDVTITSGAVPEFSLTDSYCSGEVVAVLPSVSDNGIAGTWVPGVISNTASFDYTFTPAAGVCGQPYILSVTVSPAVTPTFTPIDPLCSSSGYWCCGHIEQRSDGDVESCEYQSGLR